MPATGGEAPYRHPLGTQPCRPHRCPCCPPPPPLQPHPRHPSCLPREKARPGALGIRTRSPALSSSQRTQWGTVTAERPKGNPSSPGPRGPPTGSQKPPPPPAMNERLMQLPAQGPHQALAPSGSSGHRCGHSRGSRRSGRVTRPAGRPVLGTALPALPPPPPPAFPGAAPSSHQAGVPRGG